MAPPERCAGKLLGGSPPYSTERTVRQGQLACWIGRNLLYRPSGFEHSVVEKIVLALTERVAAIVKDFVSCTKLLTSTCCKMDQDTRDAPNDEDGSFQVSSKDRSEEAACARVGLGEILWEPVVTSRLDLAVTQLDISKKLRNASRHLDDASLLSLPVAIYKDLSDNVVATGTESQYSLEESWQMINRSMCVSSNNFGSITSEANKSTTTGTATERPGPKCVICMEHFEDDDEVRILPCDHLFHRGCIDTWLLGICSEQDCYTLACPICRTSCHASTPTPSQQRPTPITSSCLLDDIENRQTRRQMFERLGGAMARSLSMDDGDEEQRDHSNNNNVMDLLYHPTHLPPAVVMACERYKVATPPP